MKRYTNIVGFAVAIVLLFASCRQDESFDVKPQGGEICLTLGLPFPGMTRAEENGEAALNENTINRLDVFIYPQNGNDCAFYQSFTGSPLFDNAVATQSLTLNAMRESFAQGGSYVAYLLANYTGSEELENLSLSALKSLTVNSLNPDAAQASFLMDGTSAAQVLNNGTIGDVRIPVSLKRAVAKIRLSINFTDRFQLAGGRKISKKIFNYAANTVVLESGDAIVPHVLNSPDYTDLHVGGEANRIILYSYANDWSDNYTRETYVRINVPMEIDGELYEENYYNVPVNFRMSAEEHDPSLEKLERNHLYEVEVLIDKVGSIDPMDPLVTLNANYTIRDWTSKEVLVSVENIHFLHVQDKEIVMPNETLFVTSFQSSTPDVTIENIKVNGANITNGEQGVWITPTAGSKTGTVTINSSLPGNFIEKSITFTVKNGAGLTEEVTVAQYPPLYISYHTTGSPTSGGSDQNNKNMYIMSSLIADYSTLPLPDEFDESWSGLSPNTHYAPNSTLGEGYANLIRSNAVLGYPKLDSQGRTVDDDENNRRISPRFMLASQAGTTAAANYSSSRNKCDVYSEIDNTTGETYSDWRMPTLYELYLIDVLQNIRVCAVKRILEGGYYWSSKGGTTDAVNFMDPRIALGTGSNAYSPSNAAVRCVRDVK